MSVDLLPGGSSIHVAPNNVAQYCDLHARHLLVHAIHKQFAAFQRGFLRLCSGAALQLFRWVPMISIGKDGMALSRPGEGRVLAAATWRVDLWTLACGRSCSPCG